MGGTAAGASSSALPFLFDPSSAASAFGPIKRLPLAPGLRAYSRIIISPFRLRPRCRSRNRDGIKFESNGSHARISEEELLNDWVSLPSASPYQILGVNPTSCSPTELKAAFRARVKEFHPDVYKGKNSSNEIICRIIDAYKMLSKQHQFDSVIRSASDTFEDPECVACDVFINELLCMGKGCPYSCVKRAPFAFSFTSEHGTARAISQGHYDDYQVHLAVGQCPRSCIHYVTPSQREILQNVLQRILSYPCDMAELAYLESLILKAMLENRRYQKPTCGPS